MNAFRRYGKIVAAAALRAVLSGCVVVPVTGFYGPPRHAYYYGGGGYYR
jgi:hypothetical protein